MDYPVWSPAMGGGVLIGLIAIAHVVVSHFAVGGGILMAVTETLAVRRGDAALRGLARRSSTMLILVSTVFGAISGVGIWFVIGLISPAATSALIRTYVWGWAIEWTFFLLEIATALAWAATWDRVRPRTHLALIWLYSLAAFLSLVVIQGILSFMLTPGRWLETRGFWDGFFNPTYASGLLFRTGICILLAGTYLMLAAQRERDPAARSRLVRFLAPWQVGGAMIAIVFWHDWKLGLPPEVRGLFDGDSALIAGLAETSTWLMYGLYAAGLLGLFAWLRPRWYRWPVAVVALLAGFLALGGYERVREGARKPFVIRGYMFSNGVRTDQIEMLNEKGVLATSGWAAREAGIDPIDRGRALFRTQCSACHTGNGYLSIRRLLEGSDPDRVHGVIGLLRADGETWVEALSDGRVAPDPDVLNYSVMPPFVGTEEEAHDLGLYLLDLIGPKFAEAASVQGDFAAAKGVVR